MPKDGSRGVGFGDENVPRDINFNFGRFFLTGASLHLFSISTISFFFGCVCFGLFLNGQSWPVLLISVISLPLVVVGYICVWTKNKGMLICYMLLECIMILLAFVGLIQIFDGTDTGGEAAAEEPGSTTNITVILLSNCLFEVGLAIFGIIAAFQMFRSSYTTFKFYWSPKKLALHQGFGDETSADMLLSERAITSRTPGGMDPAYNRGPPNPNLNYNPNLMPKNPAYGQL